MKKLLCLVLAMCLLPLGAMAGSTDVLNTESELPIVKEPITLSIFGKQGAIHADWPTMDFFKEYQKMTGITLDFQQVPSQGYDENKGLMFASPDKLPDMLVVAGLSGTEIIKYGADGVLIPLEDLLPVYAPNYSALMEKYPDIEGRISAPDGHIYGISLL